jgi:hypothetical protein
MTTRRPDTDLPASLRALVNLSTVDLLYADLYLDRAGVLLPGLCPKEQYRALRHDQLRLPSLTADLRHATEHGDWPRVRALAQEAAAARERLAAASQILPLADQVYGPRLVHCDATTLALNGVVAQPDTNLVRARDCILEQLRTLASQDADWASLYNSRITYFEHCQLANGEKVGPVVDITQLRQQVLTAITAGDFARITRLTDSISAEPTTRTARLHAPRPREEQLRALATVFSDATVKRAATLGLTMETLPRAVGLNEYLSCCCADRATFPNAPITETNRPVESCTCGHACPPDVRPSLRENLDFLMGHPYISSAGLLGLPKRRGCARIVIEDALLTNGPRVCTELGLDPAEFVVACIPFDAYVRLAPERGWGQQELWTHFDGYQVTRELGLWAVVGGHASYGGGDNLSSVPRDYDSDRLTVRFAILRRQRFLAREIPEGHQ